MIAEISCDTSEVPYAELKISPKDYRDPYYEITFRKYRHNVFVGVGDDRGNPFSGADLEDCFLAPTIIIEKTPRDDFDPKKAFIKAIKFLQEMDELLDEDYWNGIYKEFEHVVKKWEATLI